MTKVDAVIAGTTASEPYDFTEDAILTKVPDLNGVFGLFRYDQSSDCEEAVLIGSGILRHELIMACRTHAAPQVLTVSDLKFVASGRR